MRPCSNLKGFSLIEITIALGIVAFALVAIMGLFPVAMKNATESQRETRATFIAQSIFSDLAASSATNRFIAIGSDLTSSGSRQSVGLTNNSTNSVFYSDEGAPLGTALSSAAAFEGKILIARDPALTNLSRVEVQIEAPAAAPTTNRTKYNFVTLLRNN